MNRAPLLPLVAALSPRASGTAAELADVASWWWYVARTSVVDGWRWLPGPWWVKVLLIVLIAAGQLCPGELDEILILAAIGWVKRRMDARKNPVSIANDGKS